MQCTTAPSFSIPHLLRVFAQIPDPRTRRGQRYALASLLTSAVAAILSNHRSVLAIAEWVADRTPAQRRALGFQGSATPHQTTFARLFRRLDPPQIAAVLMRALHPRTASLLPARGSRGVSVDGKALRGALRRMDPTPWPIQTIRMVDHATAVILAHTAVLPTHPASEARIALTMLPEIDWTGRVLTGDAAYCRPALCAAVQAVHGDYLVSVKANHPTLLHDLQWLFADPTALEDYRTATVIEHSHGRRTIRTIQVSSDLTGYHPWPGLAQAFAIQREWWDRAGQRHVQTQYGITSLPAADAPPRRLLALKQGHWTIENRVHYVSDCTLSEDASPIHCDAGPHVMTLLRDGALNLLRLAGHRSVAAAIRFYSRNPAAVLHLVGVEVPENA